MSVGARWRSIDRRMPLLISALSVAAVSALTWVVRKRVQRFRAGSRAGSGGTPIIACSGCPSPRQDIVTTACSAQVGGLPRKPLAFDQLARMLDATLA